ncbi:hypothetical protein CAOG_00353 [Capsaspora owczarzaki ATCC 30864]|uniref:E3 ubiquitin-protein ligase RNF170 n=1 Tax=Capsaspora owczarzaki (strain ATCC 30864) TaxID=595528 RepID=A0A0D2WIE1_CAPO3|nr:hypothetical protein CAOG_00353 [Capsaspora owczarzaki ATCC 30864]KJE88763.1 hypothetical protein CAOG_000353 [Capsaspora owczarzaki ATCC 30864]|eukprot:XP_004365224.1 hypothetical protein CAOG_00353 [Capsaspora owczarzaki ATCC 30864]
MGDQPTQPRMASSVLEGVDDDVIVLCSGALTTVASAAALVWWLQRGTAANGGAGRRRRAPIHPQAEQGVLQARANILQHRRLRRDQVHHGEHASDDDPDTDADEDDDHDADEDDDQNNRNSDRPPSQRGVPEAPPLMQRQGSRRFHEQDDACPICLQQVQFAIETNCGHVFCSPCVVEYWRHSAQMQAMQCPNCRQRVTLLLPEFTAAELASAESARHRRHLDEYNRTFADTPRSLLDHLRDTPQLFRRIIHDLFTGQSIVRLLRLRAFVCMLVCLLYLLSPFDLIPEEVFGAFGLIDDLLVILLILVYFGTVYRAAVVQRLVHQQ